MSKEVINFLIEDFKDTSGKLESTDKKVQFIVQIYTAIISTVSSALIFFLAKHYKAIENVITNEHRKNALTAFVWPFFLIIFMTIIAFNICIYIYSLKGVSIHYKYLNRMNILRRKIVDSLIAKFPDKLDGNYSYTAKVCFAGDGMNMTVTIYISILINLYITLASFYLWVLIYNNYTISLCILLFGVNIVICLVQYKYFKTVREETNEAIDELWNPPLRKIVNHRCAEIRK